MKRMKKLALVCALILLAALATGCGGSASPAAAAGDSYAATGNYADDETGVSYEDAAGISAKTYTDPTQKLVYTVELRLETLDYDASLSGVEALSAEFGGYVEYAEVGNNGINTSNLRSAYYTLRIPTEALDAFLESCGSVGKIRSSVRQTENRTEEYVDLSARLGTLRAQEETLLGLLEQAQDLESIVSLNAYLSEVRYEIERIEGSLRSIDSLVNYSTVNLHIREVIRESSAVGSDSSFGERVSARAGESWAAFTASMQSFGVFLLGRLPMLLLMALVCLLPFAIIVLIILLAIRVSRKKRAARSVTPQPDAQRGDERPDQHGSAE